MSPKAVLYGAALLCLVGGWVGRNRAIAEGESAAGRLRASADSMERLERENPVRDEFGQPDRSVSLAGNVSNTRLLADKNLADHRRKGDFVLVTSAVIAIALGSYGTYLRNRSASYT